MKIVTITILNIIIAVVICFYLIYIINKSFIYIYNQINLNIFIYFFIKNNLLINFFFKFFKFLLLFIIYYFISYKLFVSILINNI